MHTPGASAPDLRLTRADDAPGFVRLALTGEIDMTTGDSFKQTLAAILDEPGVRQLLLDVSALRFLDSNGVTVLVKTLQVAEERRVSFGIVNASPPIRSVLEMLAVYDLLALDEPTRQEVPRV